MDPNTSQIFEQKGEKLKFQPSNWGNSSSRLKYEGDTWTFNNEHHAENTSLHSEKLLKNDKIALKIRCTGQLDDYDIKIMQWSKRDECSYDQPQGTFLQKFNPLLSLELIIIKFKKEFTYSTAVMIILKNFSMKD